MPLYEYQCLQCGCFELIQKFSDSPLTACPTCGAEVQKLLSAPAIQFKGAGWYVNDYAKKSSSSGDGKGEAKGEPKKDGAGTPAANSSDASSSPSQSSSNDSAASGSSSTK